MQILVRFYIVNRTIFFQIFCISDLLTSVGECIADINDMLNDMAYRLDNQFT